MKTKEAGGKISCVGLDCHRNFSSVTARDESMKVLWRGRLDHRDRDQFRRELQLAGGDAGDSGRDIRVGLGV